MGCIERHTYFPTFALLGDAAWIRYSSWIDSRRNHT
ncbi:hypothetical protein KO116_03842 [Halomonas sp. KO116]|nr:hypothetical protein KO116_03842 [Halomonas sp. KO116]